VTDHARTLIGVLGSGHLTRPLKRVIQRQLVDKPALRLLGERVRAGQKRGGEKR